jgi:hypothetical protein
MVSLMISAAPASADENEWEMEVTPGPIGYARLVDSDISDFGVYGDGEVIWAVTGSDNYTYKSTNGGVSWIRGNAEAFGFTPDLIAVAPDDPDIVAIVNTDNASALEVQVTTNGGGKWSGMPTPIQEGSTGAEATAIMDVDMSASYLGVNNVCVSGIDENGEANAWYFEVGAAAPSWFAMNGLSGFRAGHATKGDVMPAIAFSPNFPSDLVMVALVSDNGTGSTENLTFEIFSYSGKPPLRKWNSEAGFPTQYPVTLISGVEITAIDSASIALDPEYLGSDDVMRNAFVGLAIDGGTTAEEASGIYRLKDTDDKDLKTNVLIHSVAYNGTNLVAGTYTGDGGDASTVVWRSSDPMASIPTFYPTASLKSPGGENEVRLAWGGADLFSGTSGDESAFGVSRNDGKSFNDLSLIDTEVTNSTDVGVSPDGSNVYWATDDGGDLSIWRTQGTGYERVLSVLDEDTFIVRVAPDDPDVVYVADKGSTRIYYTKDAGEEKWFTRTCGLDVQDLAVESADVVYAMNTGGGVCKSTNAGFTWGPETASKLGSGFSILSVSEDVVFVTSNDGFVSYSLDGNMTWDDIKKPVETAGSPALLAADTDYANNNIIYAIRQHTGANFMKWEVGTSTSWTDIFDDDLSATQTTYGLATIGGNLYALVFDTSDNQSSLYQCLEPLRATKTSPSWASEPTTSITDPDDDTVFLGIDSASPNGLKLTSNGSNKAWACKTNGTNRLYGYADTLMAAGPTLIAPKEGFTNPINTVTGYANEISFSCDRLSNATAYELQIAYDEIFTEFTAIIKFEDDHPSAVMTVGHDKTAGRGVTEISGSVGTNFMPGVTYYYRMKAVEALYSPWSESRSFTVEPGVALVPIVGSPQNGAIITTDTPAFSWSPVAGATMYEFQLASDTTFASPITKTELAETGIQPAGALSLGTYFWRVRAITPVMGGWSTIANFTVAEPVVEEPQEIVIPPQPAPTITVPEIKVPPPEVVVQPPPEAPTVTPGYIWAIVIIGAVLVIAVIVLIIRTRRAV